jgi:hypothetical protein
MRRSRQAERMRNLLAMALVGVALATGSACGGGEASSVSSDEIQRDAKVVLRADLKSGTTGETAAKIVRRFISVEGVWGTRGDDGKHVWIYGTTDVTSEQAKSIHRQLEDVSSVESVTQLR